MIEHMAVTLPTAPLQDILPPGDDEPANADQTLEFFIRRSKRRRFPIRRTFVQGRTGRKLVPGPLALITRERRGLALDLWALHGGIASHAPWNVRVSAMTWARMLDMPQTINSETAISRQWAWLVEKRLVRTKRVARLLRVERLMEDGSGRTYDRPTGAGGGYFYLPAEYFTTRWHTQLKLPGKTALFLALAQAPTFDLPLEQAVNWYGISADTLGRGFAELQDLGLVKIWQRKKLAPNSRYGVTTVNHYALTGPFARPPIKRE
jgi:hypothetical protein